MIDFANETLRELPKKEGFDLEKVEAGIKLVIEGIGHPKDDENIQETPARVARMYKDILDGYHIDAKKYLKTFPSNNNDMVIIRNTPIYSYCSHHLQPFYGKLTIAYIPNGRVLGMSKLIRIARVFAKKLQLQENLTAEIAEFLFKELNCKGVAVSIKAQHMCMVIRGSRSYGSETVTTKLLGDFKENQNLRDEFMRNLSDKEGY